MSEAELKHPVEPQLPDLKALLQWQERTQLLSGESLRAELDRCWTGFDVWEKHFQGEERRFMGDGTLVSLVSEINSKIQHMVKQKSAIETMRSTVPIDSAA